MLLISAVDDAGSNIAHSGDLGGEQPGPISFFVLSIWCGIVAGLFEVATIVIRKQLFDANHIYGMSRHFIWLIPTIYLGVFGALGLFGTLVVLISPRRGRWLLVNVLCSIVLLPIFLIAFPRIYTFGWIVMCLGVATRIVPVCESNRRLFRRFVRCSFPVAVGLLLLLLASPWVSDRIKLARERARPLPPPGSPNVLLIVLDTVAASHLNLYGYGRPTSTTLMELAERGIRFDSARAASSWTLPSHATMFTGRWMHELSVGWLNPLDETHPTLAEYLGSRGYATAGFVANTMFCASDSGLGRGFTRYEDFIFPNYSAFKTAALVNRALALFGQLLPIVEQRPSLGWARPMVQRFWELFVFDRKGAAAVTREFLEWLTQRTEPERPFFAFLNYSDAHTPYELSENDIHRFGAATLDVRQQLMIKRWGDLDKIRVASADLSVVVDAYDDCIAALDERVGRLLDKLDRRGVLDRTWLVIVSDHGESFGEHPGVFCHGTSLYQTEVHVPLVIVPPGGAATKLIVNDTVSLRNLAATIVDVLGLASGSPLPGSSLARYWRNTGTTAPTASAAGDPALSELVPGLATNVDADGLPMKTWPVGAIDDGDWSYIRREGNVREELFHLKKDVREERNLARNPTAQPILDRMRQILGELTGGPLIPQRFNR